MIFNSHFMSKTLTFKLELQFFESELQFSNPSSDFLKC